MSGVVSSDWMQSYTGKKFHPMDLQRHEVCLEDVAHALSQLCRYGGHTRKFYSVAEHCWLLSYGVGDDPYTCMIALLHDATEAYLIDLPRPIKRAQGMEEYRAAEQHAMETIFRVLSPVPDAGHGLVWTGRGGWDLPYEIHDADTRILLNERKALLPAVDGQPWGCDGKRELDIDYEVQGWGPAMAEKRYLARYRQLEYICEMKKTQAAAVKT